MVALKYVLLHFQVNILLLVLCVLSLAHPLTIYFKWKAKKGHLKEPDDDDDNTGIVNGKC